MKTNLIFLIAGGVIMAALLLVVVMNPSAGVRAPPAGQPGGTTPLPPVEVRNYEGKDLSSVNDFRENSIDGPQYINETDYRLTITGLPGTKKVYSYREVLDRFPHYSKVVALHCVEGWDVTILWEGILVRDLLADAGTDGNATTVIFRAHDGYTTSFPIGYLANNDIIMAYRMNNITLPAERGFPFQLVAQDKWGYKWIKWIEEIELTRNSNYRGYWEQRGYSNTADLDKNYYAD